MRGKNLSCVGQDTLQFLPLLLSLSFEDVSTSALIVVKRLCFGGFFWLFYSLKRYFVFCFSTIVLRASVTIGDSSGVVYQITTYNFSSYLLYFAPLCVMESHRVSVVTFLRTFATSVLRWFELGGTYEVQKHAKKRQQRELLMRK